MNQEQKNRLDILTTFCGYGDLDKAKIFFMGIEEHQTMSCLEVNDFVQKLIGRNAVTQKEYTWLDSSGVANGLTERMQRKVYLTLTTRDTLPEEQIFEHGVHCFNYYPLGANQVSVYPSHYNDCLGLDFKGKPEFYRYFEEKTERKRILELFIKEQILEKGKMLFVLGKGYWNKLEELLPHIEFIENKTKNANSKLDILRWSIDKQIWLTGHPSHNWFNNDVLMRINSIRNAL